MPNPSRRPNSNVWSGPPGPPDPPTKIAVFMDAGAVFFAARALHEDKQLDYAVLMQVIAKQGFPLPGGPPTLDPHDMPLWVMWTSSIAQNPGQVRFLQHAERDLKWRVRRFHPADGYMVDPVSVGLTGDTRSVNRLLRFDASIAFAIGRVAEDHRIAVITDSFALAEPLQRAATMSGQGSPNLIVFFSRLLDPRWQRRLREEDGPAAIQLLDLDEHEQQLFGASKPHEITGWNDDFLLK